MRNAWRPAQTIYGAQLLRPCFVINVARANNSSRFALLMANTYSQIYIQVVFAVQARQNLIRPERKEELQKYITGIVKRQGQKLIAIN